MNGMALSAGATMLVVLLMFWTSVRVGRARMRYGVQAPAVSGHPMFERAYRVQMNTLEWALMLLPSLWVASAFVSDGRAALLAVIGVAGRVVYALSYQHDPARRAPGFVIGALAFAVIAVMALAGVFIALMA